MKMEVFEKLIKNILQQTLVKRSIYTLIHDTRHY